MADIKTILFLGPTGSGKETQANFLHAKTGFEIFSTGKRYRKLRSENTDLAARIKIDYDQGLLMPAWFSTFIFQEAFLYRPLAEGVICEGLGRTLFESKSFDEVMQWLGRDYVVFCLNIAEEESMARQMKRAETESRPDSDSAEKIRVRFTEYNRHTAPAIAFFREKGKVIDIDGSQTPEKVFEEVWAAYQNL